MIRQVLANKHFLMITAGFIAVAVILFSSSIYQTKDNLQKAKVEQSEKTSGSTVSLTGAANDVISGGGTTQLAPKILMILECLQPFQEEGSKEVLEDFVPSRYIRILFRAIISPNAP